MEPITTIRGIAAPLPESDINTDAIIPSVWLRDPGQNLRNGLFALRRWDRAGRPRPEFVLNRAPFDSARILIAGPNFGCGSSREAAVWALLDFGIGCVIAPSFADIFYENAFKNRLLAATLAPAELAALCTWLQQAPDPALAVDLHACKVATGAGQLFRLEIPEPRRMALISGADEMTELLALRPRVRAFEATVALDAPWLYPAAPDDGPLLDA